MELEGYSANSSRPIIVPTKPKHPMLQLIGLILLIFLLFILGMVVGYFIARSYSMNTLTFSFPRLLKK